MKTLIIGEGEVGKALRNVLHYPLSSQPEIIHICFPYSKTFESDTLQYIKKTNAKLVIIHSTVQIGTTSNILEKVNIPVVHSPVQGQHPDLTKSILYFVKFVGTTDIKAFSQTIKELSNLRCVQLSSPETSELGKMFSTSYYGLCIAWHREMKTICDELDIDFEEAVTDFNAAYNEGYHKFKSNVIRPILTPPEGSIGGHCVTQNARLLEEKRPSEFLKIIQ